MAARPMDALLRRVALCLQLLLTMTVTQLDAVPPVGVATFPGLTGNMTFTSTNGFGTYASGVISNLTCNNPVGNLLPGNPLVGSSSVPCRVAMTIHNVANATGARSAAAAARIEVESRQLPINWGQILGGGFPAGSAAAPNGNAQLCGDNIGSLFNPTKSDSNPLGFLGNMEVINGTGPFAGVGRFVSGPFNFTLDNPTNPFSVLFLPVVIWGEAFNSTLALATQYNPARILSCAFIQLARM